MDHDRELAAIAHAQRRLTFGPFPGATRRALRAHGTADRVLDAMIAAEPMPFDAPDNIDEPFDVDDRSLGNEELVVHWIDRMCRDESGLHEKMTWFWHTHFPSSFTKAAGLYCWRQLRTLHEHALGNFGELTRSMCVDAAMLQYLDGSGSLADDPNENFSRELMELFTMGRGHYTEADVRAGARALAGWSVDATSARAVFEPKVALRTPVTYLGSTGVLDVDHVVDRILAQEATAPFVVAKLVQYFIGAPASAEDLVGWSEQFRSTGYEIRPVVESILRSRAFADSRLNRSRHGIEWLCTVIRATGIAVPESYEVQEFAQVPYYPPNVAGWPDRWLTSSSLFARASFIQNLRIPEDVLAESEKPASAALERCGLFEVGSGTRNPLERLGRQRGTDGVRLLRAALMSPEFAVS